MIEVGVFRTILTKGGMRKRVNVCASICRPQWEALQVLKKLHTQALCIGLELFVAWGRWRENNRIRIGRL